MSNCSDTFMDPRTVSETERGVRVSALYPGLNQFHVNDAALFFGREKETKALLTCIEEGSVIVVVGPSGCGKSSLIQAGIMPRLLASQRIVVHSLVQANILQSVESAIQRETSRRFPGVKNAAKDFVDGILNLYEYSLVLPLRTSTSQHSQAGVIRALLRDAFDSAELRRFCHDRPAFSDVLADFSDQFSFNVMIDALIAYCSQRFLFSDLLEEIHQASPKQFERYRAQLERSGLLGRFLPSGSAVEGVTLQAMGCSQPVVLIVDQFEQALLSSHPKEALESFLKGLYRLMHEPICCATVIIVVKADLLYYLRASVRDSESELRGSIEFDIDPLNLESARTAIVAPLEAHGIPYEEAVISDIVACLQRTSVEPISRPYIQPIQMQIVIRALCEQAFKGLSPQAVFTRENLDRAGSVENILRNFFVERVGNRSESWRFRLCQYR